MSYSIKHKVLAFILSIFLLGGIGSIISGCSTITSTTTTTTTTAPTVKNLQKVSTENMISTDGINFKLK